MPNAFGRETKIDKLERQVKRLELQVKDAEHQDAVQKIFDKQKLDVKDSCILAQRTLL